VDVPADPAIADTAAAPKEPDAVPAAASQALPGETVLDGFLDLLSQFLRSVNEGFQLDSSPGSFRYYFSQSVELAILKSVLQVGAPEEAGAAADAAAVLIDGVSSFTKEG
jgi:hypothetical protein